MLAASTVLGAAWAVALALVDGVHGLVASVGLRSEYLIDVGRVGSPGAFLRGFVSQIATFHVHVQGHPPGFLLILWGLDRVGLAQPGWVATLEITVGVLAISAVLLAVRNVAGETAARAAAPFVACAPVAIWVATSSDAFYAGVSAWAVAVVVLATRGVTAVVTCWRWPVVSCSGSPCSSYGLVLLAIVPATVGGGDGACGRSRSPRSERARCSSHSRSRGSGGSMGGCDRALDTSLEWRRIAPTSSS